MRVLYHLFSRPPPVVIVPVERMLFRSRACAPWSVRGQRTFTTQPAILMPDTGVNQFYVQFRREKVYTTVLRRSPQKHAHTQYKHTDRDTHTDTTQTHTQTQGHDLGRIRGSIQELRSSCKARNVQLMLGFSSSMLPLLTPEVPRDFQGFPANGYESVDGSGKRAIGT